MGTETVESERVFVCPILTCDQWSESADPPSAGRRSPLARYLGGQDVPSEGHAQWMTAVQRSLALHLAAHRPSDWMATLNEVLARSAAQMTMLTSTLAGMVEVMETAHENPLSEADLASVLWSAKDVLRAARDYDPLRRQDPSSGEPPVGDEINEDKPPV